LKILLYDIENSPNLGWTWGKYEQNVIEFKDEWYLLSFAYKWLGESKVHAYSLPDFKLYKKDKQDDSGLVKKLWEVMNEADVIIAHNGDQFDIRKTNARFIAHGLTPPKPYQTIDTKKVAKKYFMFNSNKLDDLGKYFGVGRKKETGGFELWKGCMVGDKKSWKKMVTYNKQDVVLLEEVYKKLLPWIGNHPNINLVSDVTGACPNCGSTHLQKRGFGYTRVSKYQRYQCNNCHAWSRGKNIKSNVEIR
jgi:DNA polymerase elongation subunit (family B)